MEMGTAVSTVDCVATVDCLSATLNTLRGNQFLSLYDCKSQIDELLSTVPKVRDVLLRVADAQELSEQQRSYIMKLKDAVFDANTQLNKVAIRAHQIQLRKSEGGLSKKASLFCSHLNPHWVAFCISREVQKLRNRFDSILINTSDIAIKPIRETQTCSYSCEDSYIIGREDDLEKVVGMLLDSSSVQHDDVSFLSIVGVGGLGKTILARLVFNDKRVTDAFSLKMWICFTTEDQKQLDINGILRKILASATASSGQNHEDSSMDQVKSQLREQLDRHRYLLILDYVWIEHRDQWCDLVRYLVGCQRGSCVLVTTRSKKTAKLIGGDRMYMLEVLSDDNSWRLLKKLAFGNETIPDDLAGIAQEIVQHCNGLPLAISVGASLLSDQNKSKLQSVEEIRSAAIRESVDVIMAVHNYRHLESPLKSCFSYCALFPKDFEIEKEKLKSLWMAQGYIVPLHEDQSIEDACEKYFSMLLDRCIFQGIKSDKYGQIVSCKIHDIMYKLLLSSKKENSFRALPWEISINISQHVAGKEMRVMNTLGGNLDKDVHHLSVIGGKFDEYTLGKTHFFSYLHLDYDGIQAGKVNRSYLESLVVNCLSLKALDLSGLIFESLPDSVCRLIQLRYLNISGNTEMKSLPKSITKLHNLQTLMLRRCHTLKELPADLTRLVNLRLLDIRYCSSLTCMPSGMDSLTCLHRLSDYVVGGEHWNQWFDGLDDLKPLHNLRGCLNIHIRWPKNVKNVVEKDSERNELCLGGMEHLDAVLFDFIHDDVDGSVDNVEAIRVMGKLHPHQNLKYLEVKKYHGLRMPDWVTLPLKLVELHLTDCKELMYLPCLGNLRCLKVLRLVTLDNLECIGEDSPLADSSSTLTPQSSIAYGSSYLPPLETLEMSNLPKLKGWRSGVADDQFLNVGSNKSSSNGFSELKTLFIWNCPELTCFPTCPKMEELTLLNFNSRLQMIIDCERDDNSEEVVISIASSSSKSPHPKNSTAIKKVAISNVSWLSSVPAEAFQSLECLDIWGDKKLGSLRDAGNVFCGCSSSLKYLIIRNCCTLSNIVPGGLEHLTALEKIEIRDCNELRLSEEQQEVGLTSLLTLILHGLPQLMNLPSWMQFLPALQFLDISFCRRLKSMPDWMPKLTCLTHLSVTGCSKSLKRRCQKTPPGEDWPYIQHIPDIKFQECFY